MLMPPNVMSGRGNFGRERSVFLPPEDMAYGFGQALILVTSGLRNTFRLDNIGSSHQASIQRRTAEHGSRSRPPGGLMSESEALAREGLDIDHYPGKWKSAQRLAASNERRDGYHLLPYWERVRLLYYELGGERIDGRRV
jgi:hypothetical protein